MTRRRYARGLANLGHVIDERVKQDTNRLVYPRDLGQAVPAPAAGENSGGSTAGTGNTAGVAVPVTLFMPGVSFVPLTLEIGEEGETAPYSFHTAAWPTEASLSSISAQPQTEAFLLNTNLGRSCAYFCWTSVGDGLTVTAGAAVGLGFACAKAWHGTARSRYAVVRACVRVENADRFSALHLVLNDVDDDDEPGNRTGVDLLPNLTNSQWVEVSLSATLTDISSWGDYLRVGLFALGTESPAYAGFTEFSVAWLQIELWPG